MSKASVRIDELADYFRFAGGKVRGGSLADVELFVTPSNNEALDPATEAVVGQIKRNLDIVTHGLLLAAEANRGQVVALGLGYEQDDCYWVSDIVSNGQSRGAGVSLMREFARRAVAVNKELRLEALRDTGSLGFFDMLGARTVDHYNKRVLGWKKAVLLTLAGEKEIEAISL